MLENMPLLSVFKVRFTLPAPSLLPACAHPSGRIGALTYVEFSSQFPPLRPHMPQPYTSPQNAQVWEQASVDEFEYLQARARPALMRPFAASDAARHLTPLCCAQVAQSGPFSFLPLYSSPIPASSSSYASNALRLGAPLSA